MLRTEMSAEDNHVLAVRLDSNINSQESSTLCTRIPPEIRLSIFSLAVTAYDDGPQYMRGTYYDRPEYHFHHRIDTALLQTCRRIYLETSLLPVKLNEMVRWGCYHTRAPPHVTGDFATFFPYLLTMHTVEQQAVLTAHIFPQQWWLEDRWPKLTRKGRLSLSVLHITMRHTDWYNWWDGARLCFNVLHGKSMSYETNHNPSSPFSVDSWGYSFRHLHGLKHLILELETIEEKKAELDAIISRAGSWQICIADGGKLALNPQKTKQYTWRGVDRFYNYPDGYDKDKPTESPYQTPRSKPTVIETLENALETGTPDPLFLDALSPNLTTETVPELLAQEHDTDAYVKMLSRYLTKQRSVATGQTERECLDHKDIKQTVHREREELDALHYYVVKLTWDVVPVAAEYGNQGKSE